MNTYRPKYSKLCAKIHSWISEIHVWRVLLSQTHSLNTFPVLKNYNCALFTLVSKHQHSLKFYTCTFIKLCNADQISATPTKWSAPDIMLLENFTPNCRDLSVSYIQRTANIYRNCCRQQSATFDNPPPDSMRNIHFKKMHTGTTIINIDTLRCIYTIFMYVYLCYYQSTCFVW